jgi:hypothetical protein
MVNFCRPFVKASHPAFVLIRIDGGVEYRQVLDLEPQLSGGRATFVLQISRE